MTLGLPHQATSWWVILLLGLAGAGVGLWLSRALAGASYRKPDERAAPLPGHTWWLGIAVALTWACLTFRLGGYAHWSLLPAYLYLGAVGAALTLVDLDVHRLPDLLVLPSYPIAFVLLLVPTVVLGRWGDLLRAALAGLALYLIYLLMALFSPVGSGLGFGDVKLAGVLGLLLGWLGWGPVIVSFMAAWVVAGVAGALLILARRATRKSNIAFGPAMIVGALVAVMFPLRALTG
jgi:leader peptidase (prepilin peptidase)/N-methyltransferase